MPKLSSDLRGKVISQLFQGVSIKKILMSLEQQGVAVSRQTIWRLRKHVQTHGSTSPLPRSGRPTKLTREVLAIIEAAMQEDDETTAKELKLKLDRAGTPLSLRTILKGRKSLGWSYRGTAYCQMIREVNKQKRLQWALANQQNNFEDVIWSDETSVQLESHRRYCCKKNGQKPRYKPRPKHPLKVHVWGGISWNGRTEICIFDGIMDARMYTYILSRCLVPFLYRIYPNGHRFMQDNDPKHTSKHAQEFFENNSINWWRTPPESPDSNPIENLWHELKVCICSTCCIVLYTCTCTVYVRTCMYV